VLAHCVSLPDAWDVLLVEHGVGGDDGGALADRLLS